MKLLTTVLAVSNGNSLSELFILLSSSWVVLKYDGESSSAVSQCLCSLLQHGMLQFIAGVISSRSRRRWATWVG